MIQASRLDVRKCVYLSVCVHVCMLVCLNHQKLYPKTGQLKESVIVL